MAVQPPDFHDKLWLVSGSAEQTKRTEQDYNVVMLDYAENSEYHRKDLNIEI